MAKKTAAAKAASVDAEFVPAAGGVGGVPGSPQMALSVSLSNMALDQKRILSGMTAEQVPTTQQLDILSAIGLRLDEASQACGLVTITSDGDELPEYFRVFNN